MAKRHKSKFHLVCRRSWETEGNHDREDAIHTEYLCFLGLKHVFTFQSGSGADENQGSHVLLSSQEDSERPVTTSLCCLWCHSDDRRRALLTVTTPSPLNSEWLQPSQCHCSKKLSAASVAAHFRPSSSVLEGGSERESEERDVHYQTAGRKERSTGRVMQKSKPASVWIGALNKVHRVRLNSNRAKRLTSPAHREIKQICLSTSGAEWHFLFQSITCKLLIFFKNALNL